MKSRLALILVVYLLGFTCDNDEAQLMQSADDARPAEASGSDPAARPAATVAPAPDGTAVYEDLLALAHLADFYDSSGIFIDFGTAARLKYTNGNWNSGWHDETRDGGATVSTFGKTARIYLPAPAKQPMQLRLRAKPYATGALIVYVNGKTAGEARVSKSDGFREIVIPISEAHVRAGENAIMLRSTRTAPVKGKSRSLAMDWLRFEPSGAEAAATRAVGVGSASAGGVERRAIVLPPKSRIDWFVELPDDATLVFGAGAASEDGGAVSLHVSRDRTNDTTKRIALGARWSDQQVSLRSQARAIVRLRFENEGTGEVAISDVRVVRRAGNVASIDQPARNVAVLLIDT